MKKYIFNSIFIVFFSCSTLNFTEELEKNLSVIERNEYFLYFYPGSEIYIKKDKTSNKLSVFFNVFFDYKRKFDAKEIKVLKDDELIGSIEISKIISISNLKFLYINITKDNVNLILEALNASKKITFESDSSSFQIWTKETIIYDLHYIDIDFKNTRNTLQYALKNNIL